MSSVRVIVVEGSAEDVVLVCAQLGLGGEAAKQQSSKAANEEGQGAISETARQGPRAGKPAPLTPHTPHPTPPPASVPGSLGALMPCPCPPVSLIAEPPPPRTSLPPPSGPRRPVATVGDDASRDVRVPPHPTSCRRSRQELLGDLVKILPKVGDTVRVNDFTRDDSERVMLRALVDKHNGDRRFEWLRGIAGGKRPARVRRVEE